VLHGCSDSATAIAPSTGEQAAARATKAAGAAKGAAVRLLVQPQGDKVLSANQGPVKVGMGPFIKVTGILELTAKQLVRLLASALQSRQILSMKLLLDLPAAEQISVNNSSLLVQAAFAA